MVLWLSKTVSTILSLSWCIFLPSTFFSRKWLSHQVATSQPHTIHVWYIYQHLPVAWMVWEQEKKLQEWLVLCDVLRDPSTLQVGFRIPHGLFGRVDCDKKSYQTLGMGPWCILMCVFLLSHSYDLHWFTSYLHVMIGFIWLDCINRISLSC